MTPKPNEWSDARQEARQAMVRAARQRRTITYTDLVGEIRSLNFEARDPNLNRMLGEISSAEHAAGRALLSVLVVHKSGDMMPGKGFFDLARRLGRDVSDELQFWSDELKRVFHQW